MAEILIVDDDPEILNMYKAILGSKGHLVEVAKDGEDAVELATAKRFDIIIMDIIMPKKDGIDAILEIKEIYPDIKIIAISGGGRKGNMDFLKLAQMVGACDTLAKPFNPADLLSKLNDCLIPEEKALTFSLDKNQK